MNKYRERILNMGKETDARILLPEIGDKRIQEASAELTSLGFKVVYNQDCLLYTSPSPRDATLSRMPSSA